MRVLKQPVVKRPVVLEVPLVLDSAFALFHSYNFFPEND